MQKGKILTKITQEEIHKLAIQRCEECVCWTTELDFDDLDKTGFSCFKGLPTDQYCEGYTSTGNTVRDLLNNEIGELEQVIEELAEEITELLQRKEDE